MDFRTRHKVLPSRVGRVEVPLFRTAPYFASRWANGTCTAAAGLATQRPKYAAKSGTSSTSAKMGTRADVQRQGPLGLASVLLPRFALGVLELVRVRTMLDFRN